MTTPKKEPATGKQYLAAIKSNIDDSWDTPPVILSRHEADRLTLIFDCIGIEFSIIEVK